VSIPVYMDIHRVQADYMNKTVQVINKVLLSLFFHFKYVYVP